MAPNPMDRTSCDALHDEIEREGERIAADVRAVFSAFNRRLQRDIQLRYGNITPAQLQRLYDASPDEE